MHGVTAPLFIYHVALVSQVYGNIGEGGHAIGRRAREGRRDATTNGISKQTYFQTLRRATDPP